MFRQIDNDAEMTTESASFSAEFFDSELLENYEWPVNQFAEAMDSCSPVDLSPLEDFIAQEDANYHFSVPETQSACETAVSQDLAEALDPVPSNHSQVLTQQDTEEIDALSGGLEPESAFDLAFPQDAAVEHDSVPSSHSQVLAQKDMGEIDDLFGSPEPESQDPAEAAGAVPSSTTQSENAGTQNEITPLSKEKPAFTLALPQAQPSPASASATTQSAKATSSKKVKPAYTLVLPQPAPASSSTPQNGSVATAPSKSQAKPAYTLALPEPAPASSNTTQNGSIATTPSKSQAKPAYTLALPEPAPASSNTTQNGSIATASSKNNAKPQPQSCPEAPSSATQSRKTAPSKKKAKPTVTQALPQAQPPVQIDLTASDAHQSGNGAAVSNPQTSGFQALMPQMSATAGIINASGSVPQGWGNGHFSTACDTSSEFFEDDEMENNTVVANPHASNLGPVTTSVPCVSGLPAQGFVGSSISSLPGQAPFGSLPGQAPVGPSASSAQMPQFANGVGYPFMMPGQFPVMGMGPGQQPNFMGMPHPAHLVNNFRVGQFNMSPAATGGAYPGFQAPMAYPNNGVPSMAPQQGVQPVQNPQPSANATVFQGVPPNTTLQAETESTNTGNAKGTKTTKASKAASTKAQKAQAPKPRKGQAKKAAPVQPAPVQNFPIVTQEAAAASSTGMTGWNSQLPPPIPWQPLNPDRIMMITGIHPLNLPADMEFVSKLPEVPGSAVKHGEVTNLTAQEHELVIHTAVRNIFYAGVEAGVERAIQQMVNDMDAKGEALGLAPADLPPQGPFRTKFLDTLENKMKKSAKKWAALTYEEADHLIKPVQAL
ncbi:unnamed protein product [Clonostachys solani]|uniref:Uncharacterized protein n=1 Tax=Clonostachys solani TaxID=160281 RepID=A0A9N9ZHR3_9HYPO|nr:unnamed protein product [Clonostachys solani]